MISFWLVMGLVWPTVGGNWAASVEVLGWPLLAVAEFELDGLMPVLASDASFGWISIGIRPAGVVALGVQPTGVVALGLAPLSVFSFGLVALGLWSWGCVVAGLVSLGTISAGWMSFGTIFSAGWFALADSPRKGRSIGVYAWGTRVHGLRLQRVLSQKMVEGPVQGVVSVWRKRHGALPHLAQRLEAADARRLRRCMLWVGIGACVVAGAVSPLAHSESLSSMEALGWPLVAVGDYEFVGGRAVFAGEEPRAWISIGYRPRGVVAIGFQPTGVIALGFVSIGLVPVGLVALGFLPLGLGAAGLVARGLVSFGWIAFGWAAVGWYALASPAGGAVGAYAWGNTAHGLFFARRLSGTRLTTVRWKGREHIDHWQ